MKLDDCGLERAIPRNYPLRLDLGARSKVSFQFENDIVEQPRGERVGSLLLHHSIARHLISALFPTFAVSHG